MKRIRKQIFTVILTLILVVSSVPFGKAQVFAEAAPATDSYKIVGYFPEWGIYDRNYQVKDIDASKLTHINYAFADISWNGIHGNPSSDSPNKATWSTTDPNVPLQKNGVPNGTIVLGEPWADVNKTFPGDTWEDSENARAGNFGQLKRLKQANPHLKTIISVGGWTWSNRFSDVAADPATRQVFADSAVTFLRTYGFDGVDLDWEYPVGGGLAGNSYRPADKQNYTLLLQTIRTALNQAGAQDGKQYLLTIATGASAQSANNMELSQIANIVDWINIMTYDFHGSFESGTNHNAPLYPDVDDPDKAKGFTTSESVERYLAAGVPSKKLVMGVPFYGRGWKGASATNNGEYQPTTPDQTGSISPKGTWDDSSSGNSGSFDYGDLIANYVNKNGYTRYWNDEAKVPYLYNPTTKTFISYDDTQSVEYKMNYIKNKQLGGGMFWDLSSDSRTSSKYAATSFKLLDKMADMLLNGGVGTGDTVAPTAVQNVAASNITSSSVNLSWTAATDNVGVTSYTISTGSKQWTSATNSVVANTLAADTNYTFTIVAKDAAGNVSQPTTFTVKTAPGVADTVAPTAVSNISASNVAATSLDLNWTAATDNVGVASYTITDGTNSWTSGTNAKTLTGLTANTNYTFTITAKDAAGNVSPAKTFTVKTAVAPTGNAAATFTVTTSWGTGFDWKLEIVNNGSTPINNWNIAFDAGMSLTSVYDGTLVSHVGTKYTYRNNGWNSVIPVGGKVTIGGGGSGTPGTISNVVVSSN